MKYLLVLLVIFTGCSSPKPLVVGDCFMTNLIDGKPKVFKIIEEGKYSYKIIDDKEVMYQTSTKDRLSFDQVDCFDKFNKKEK